MVNFMAWAFAAEDPVRESKAPILIGSATAAAGFAGAAGFDGPHDRAKITKTSKASK